MNRSLIQSFVAKATLAPNSHNTQPWLFSIEKDAIELRADRTRSLPVVDPGNRAMVISCGAALGTLRAAIQGAGYDADVARFPDPADPDLLARTTIGKPRKATPQEQWRAESITKRRTNRGPFEPWQVPRDTLTMMHRTAAAEGAWLHVIGDMDEKFEVASLIAEGDRRQGSDPEFRKELASWLHPNMSHARDGMPANTFGVGDVMSLPFPWVIRTFDWGNGQSAKDRELALGSPVLAVLGTDEDSPADWLRAGEALALALLDMTAAGLAASFMNQPIEVDDLRAQLTTRLDLAGAPQLILRVGYAVRAAPAAPRRVLADVVLN